MNKREQFLERIATAPILSDGALGTMLHQRGVSFEESFDHLNLTRPALVADIHREYIEAGSQMIQTNTFGSNHFKLSHHGLENKVREINAAGVELARRVVMASFKEVLIAGDIGPLGVRIAPFGRVQLDQAYQAFAEQISALAEAGVDVLIIETMTDLYELQEAVRAARECAPHLPIIASMTYTRDDRTVLGDTPGRIAKTLADKDVDLVGVNCSGGPNQILRILRQMHQAVSELKFSVMPNAGWPEQVGGRIKYPASPEYFGEYVLSFLQNGARVIGGCCGTTPTHIAAMSRALASAPSVNEIELLSISTGETEDSLRLQEQPTHLAQKLKAGNFTIAVEMDPPRGLATEKLLAGASLLSESGADVINVADSPMARMRMSPWAVCNLIQRKINIETVLHFPTRGRNLLRVQGDLLAAHALGVRNVFVVMGDPTSIGDYPEAMDNYDVVPSGLIKLIKQSFNLGVDLSGADIGQPTSFFVGCALNLAPPDFDQEIKNLRRKIRAGVDFILTQPIYQADCALEFLDAYQQKHGELNVPILVGILPLASYRHATFLNHEVPGINIPDSILERMQKAGNQAAREGIEIANEFIQQVQDFAQGIYIMPAFNRFDYAAEIISRLRENSRK